VTQPNDEPAVVRCATAGRIHREAAAMRGLRIGSQNVSATGTLGTGHPVTPSQIMGEDVIDVLLEDHREFEQMLASLRSGRHHRLAGVLSAALIRHGIAEEEYVYPALRDHAADGDRVADRGMAQHAQLAETIQQLDTAHASDADRQRLVAALTSEISRHIQHDRVELFPRLRATCTRSHLTWLGERAAGLRQVGGAMISSYRVFQPGALIEEVRSALAERLGGDQR